MIAFYVCFFLGGELSVGNLFIVRFSLTWCENVHIVCSKMYLIEFYFWMWKRFFWEEFINFVCSV